MRRALSILLLLVCVASAQSIDPRMTILEASISFPQTIHSAIAHWRFDGALTAAENGYDGTGVNGPGFHSGYYAYALALSKTNYVQFNSYATNLNIAAPASLSMWVYPTNAANVGLGGWGQALFQARNDAGTHLLIFGYGNGTSTIYSESFYVAAANPASASVQAATDNTYTNYMNRWSHVILVAGGFGDWRIYINGARQPLTTWPNGTNQVGYWSKNMSTTAIDRVVIGMAIDEPGNAFQGYIDDVRLYPVALTDDEAASLQFFGDL